MALNPSEFDLKIGLIQEIIIVSNQDSQRIQSDIKRARQQLQQLRLVIENKNQNCIRELQPRIKQLEQKIDFYWDGVKKMHEMAWKDLQTEDAILVQCQDFVGKLQDQITKIQSKI